MNGFSTSLPDDVQGQMLRTIPGLEKAEIIRPGYAIEYDFVDPVQLQPTLETKPVKGLFLPGRSTGRAGTRRRPRRGSWRGSTRRYG